MFFGLDVEKDEALLLRRYEIRCANGTLSAAGVLFACEIRGWCWLDNGQDILKIRETNDNDDVTVSR